MNIESLLLSPHTSLWGGLFILALAALLGAFVARPLILKAIKTVTHRSDWQWDDALYKNGVFQRLTMIVPTLIVQIGVQWVPEIAPETQQVIKNIALAGTLFFAIRAAGALLQTVQDLPQKQNMPVHFKGYIQLFKIIIYVVGFILIIAILMNRSPLLLLSGLGALSAVLLLVFKDTILGFVASVQISSNDMLRTGDWIEMPSAGADGAVMDISLHTVKVRNWDQTITTIPTWRLISESFKNWRGMFDAGGRRIKRSIRVDANSVRFLTSEETQALRRFRLLDGYIQEKHEDVRKWNEALGEPGLVPVNQRRLTNIGCFRAYAQAYLRAHPEIRHDMICMVRQLATEGEGVPLEVYGFTSKTAWLEYERIQADIFDHLFAILPEFGLGLYQKPIGADVRRAGPFAATIE